MNNLPHNEDEEPPQALPPEGLIVVGLQITPRPADDPLSKAPLGFNFNIERCIVATRRPTPAEEEVIRRLKKAFDAHLKQILTSLLTGPNDLLVELDKPNKEQNPKNEPLA